VDEKKTFSLHHRLLHPPVKKDKVVYSLRNLTYCSPGSSEPLIEDLTIDLSIGENLLIKGPSGAGKSVRINNLREYSGLKRNVLLLYYIYLEFTSSIAGIVAYSIGRNNVLWSFLPLFASRTVSS